MPSYLVRQEGFVAKEEVIPLAHLIAEAIVLAGGKNQCAELGHRWKSIGGRACPFGECGHSQAVHECESCGAIDYGENSGEPGFDWCQSKQFDCGGLSHG
jgi:hypothetical protein